MTDTPPPRRPGPWDIAPQDTPGRDASRADPKASNPASRRLGMGAEAMGTLRHNPVALLGGSALLFAIAFFLTGSWLVAVAIVWGVWVHEYGHVLAMNRVGMGPATMHVTFFGGLAQGRRPPDSEWQGVLVALAGPFFGLLAAIPFFGLYGATGDRSWLLGALVIGALNLINLAPAPPLDGSRALGPVLARIHPTLEKVAMIGIGVAVVYWGVMTGRWILAVFLAIALLGYLRRGDWRVAARDLTPGEAVRSVGLFLLTAAACSAVTLAAILPLAGGSLENGLAVAGRYLGLPE